MRGFSSVRVLVVCLLVALAVGCAGIPVFAQSRITATPAADPAETVYQKWLNEDVLWIITPEERAAFLQLSKDADRDHFVEEFWRRRDPARTFSQNEFKEEHYRRLAYANTHFAAGIAGYRTDRGRIFILHGPPDVVRHQLYGGSGIPRAEFWRYKSIPEFGGEIELKFVDECICGDYRLETLPKE